MNKPKLAAQILGFSIAALGAVSLMNVFPDKVHPYVDALRDLLGIAAAWFLPAGILAAATPAPASAPSLVPPPVDPKEK